MENLDIPHLSLFYNSSFEIFLTETHSKEKMFHLVTVCMHVCVCPYICKYTTHIYGKKLQKQYLPFLYAMYDSILCHFLKKRIWLQPTQLHSRPNTYQKCHLHSPTGSICCDHMVVALTFDCPITGQCRRLLALY